MDYDCYDEPVMDNPNLYVTLTESIESGYILAQDGSLIISQNSNDNFYYGE